MIDCNNVKNFFHELDRMCESNECNDCELSIRNSSADANCGAYIKNSPQSAIAVLQSWSDAHPQKTYLSDFVEKHPKAPLRTDGTPRVCIKEVGYETKTCCENIFCKDCWNTPLTEDTEC